MGSDNSFGTCCYCGRQILWVKTKAGKNMPVDPELVSYCRPKTGLRAAEKIVTQYGEVICANRADHKDAEGVGYISHFATCKRIDRHRKR